MNEENGGTCWKALKQKKRRIRSGGTFRWFWFLLDHCDAGPSDSGITREGYGMFYSEMSLVMDPQVYYDPDLGMIAGE